MRHLTRTQKVSLGFFHDRFASYHTMIDKMAGKRNDADVFTKGLDHKTPWPHVTALGMRPSVKAWGSAGGNGKNSNQ